MADNAFANIEKARQAQLDYLAEGSPPAPSMTLIEATPSRGANATPFTADLHGLPMVSRSFARWFAEACKAAGVRQGRAGVDCAGGAVMLAAEHGATAAQLESIFAWREWLNGQPLHAASGSRGAGKGTLWRNY